MPVKFPPVHEASPEGLLAIGGDLTTETLITAYTQGIFPWPVSKNSPLTWFSPDPRGILPTANLHLSQSFKKFLKKHKYQVKFNTSFDQIIHHCGSVARKHEKGTWITKEITKGYCDLFDQGYAYSVGVFDQKDHVMGGLYGVCIGGIVSGESMFHLEPNTSKLALYYTIQALKSQHIPFLDTQMVTPIVEAFGGSEIPRQDFLKQLEQIKKIQMDRETLFNERLLSQDPPF